MKKIKKIAFSSRRKGLSILLILGLIFVSFNFIVPVLAGDLGQELTIVGGVANENFIEVFDEEETLMGKVEIKKDEDVLIPIDNKVVLPDFEEDYELTVLVFPEPGYEVREYNLNGEDEFMPGEGNLIINITSSDDLVLTLYFEQEDHGPGGGGSHFIVPLLAYFEGLIDPVPSVEGMIFIPDGWTAGNVSFKAKACMSGDEIVPDDGEGECDPGTEFLSDLNIQGISNRAEINNTVSGSSENEYIIISKGFLDFGLVGIHLTNEHFNTMVDVIAGNLINVKAEAPLRMDHSYGSSTIGEAILTTQTSGSLAIFFGNDEATLRARGPKVVGITKLTGAEHKLNEDGSVNVFLPPLSVETTTTVTITIELEDEKFVTREVNIARTAIELAYEGESKTVRAGYVVHKAYLYNNMPHNDEIFDAYLQVIIYRDEVLVGYKQIQIDDKDFVNSLEKDESGSMDVVAPNSMVVYDGKIKGANKVSVFLTNGPIDYKSKTLPSIEFGIGAGVEYKWEVK